MGIIAQILDYDQPHALLIYLVVVVVGMAVGMVIWFVYNKKKERSDRARTWRLLASFTDRVPGSEDGTLIVKKETACPHCGGEIQSIDSICSHCGSDLDMLPAGDKEFGVIKRDIVIEGIVVFHERELVQIESVAPDADRPVFKYLVRSRSLGRKFHLSDEDLMV